MKLTPAVNFINVERARFLYERTFWQLFLVTCTLCVRGKSCWNDVRTKNSRVIMLMKLTSNWFRGRKYLISCFFSISVITNAHRLISKTSDQQGRIKFKRTMSIQHHIECFCKNMTIGEFLKIKFFSKTQSFIRMIKIISCQVLTTNSVNRMIGEKKTD